MWIDQETCICCGKCVPYCPMEAIVLHQKDKQTDQKPYSDIDQDECVECYTCLRAQVCPTEAIREQQLQWPRIVRRFFSDPLHVHKGTSVPGRGTEEMKTNDVTGRFREGFIGIGLEFGRPGMGTRLSEPEKAIKKLLAIGVELEPLNPLTQLIQDEATGRLNSDIRSEKVLSAFVECIVPIEKAPIVLTVIKELEGTVKTVFSLDLICKVSPRKKIPLFETIERAGLTLSSNGKVNLGLGLPLCQKN